MPKEHVEKECADALLRKFDRTLDDLHNLHVELVENYNIVRVPINPVASSRQTASRNKPSDGSCSHAEEFLPKLETGYFPGTASEKNAEDVKLCKNALRDIADHPGAAYTSASFNPFLRIFEIILRRLFPGEEF